VDEGGGDVWVLGELEDEAQGGFVVGPGEEGEEDVVAAVGDGGGDGGVAGAADAVGAEGAAEFAAFAARGGGAAEVFVDEDAGGALGVLEGGLDEGDVGGGGERYGC